MAQQNPWVRIIKRCNTKKLERLEKRLFTDIPETLLYIQALVIVALDASSLSRAQYDLLRDLFRNLRLKSFELDLETYTEFLLAIWNSGWSLTHKDNSYIVLLGTRDTDPDQQAVNAINRILDAIDIYRLDFKQAEKFSVLVAILNIVVTFSANTQSGSNTWARVLSYMQTSGDLIILRRMAEIFLGMGIPTYTQVIPFSKWKPTASVLETVSPNMIWNIPAPDNMASWLEGRIEYIKRLVEKENQAIEPYINKVLAKMDFYRSEYEDMWLEVMCDPLRGLRPDGLDCIEIKHHALKAIGYRRLILFPDTNFPNFRARYIRRTPQGGEHALEIALEPSDFAIVSMVQSDEAKAMVAPRAVTMDKILAFFAVRAMYYIVMDRIPHGAGIGAGKGNGGAPAVVRPRFRHLPQGQNSSPAARARALECFRTLPLPGFTFVIGYKRGQNPKSGEPIFILRDSDFPTP